MIRKQHQRAERADTERKQEKLSHPMSDVGSGKLSDSGKEVHDIRKARRYPTVGKAGERGGLPAPNGSRQKARPTGRTKNDRRAQPHSPRSGGGRA